MRGKNDFQARLAAIARAARHKAIIQTLQFSEDIMLRAVYEVRELPPDEMNRIREEYRGLYNKRSDSIHEDSRWDKRLWYSTEQNERELREIMGEHYGEPEERYWRKVER